jgi:hypothetical protein
MNNGSDHNLDEQAARDSSRDPSLASLIRALDRSGADERSTLTPSALERVFAASDLQLPLGTSAVNPVVGRILPLRSTNSSRTLLRYAAAAAVVVGVGSLLFVLTRSGDSTKRLDSRELVIEAPTVAPTVAPAPSAPETRIALQPTVEHLDSVLVAFSAPHGVADYRLAHIDEAFAIDASDAAQSDARVDAGLAAYHDVSFEDLSSEFAAIVTLSAARP